MAQQQQEETNFLNEQGVRVTNTRFILPKQTFAMSGITSVRNSEDKPSRLWPTIILIIGVLALAGGKDSIVFAIIMLAIGSLWLKFQKSTYHVLLHTASGEAKALSSNDEDWVSRVVHAINEAIIHRG